MDTPFLDKFGLKNSVRLVIGGYMNDGGELDTALEYVEELVEEYKAEKKKIRDAK